MPSSGKARFSIIVNCLAGLAILLFFTACTYETTAPLTDADYPASDTAAFKLYREKCGTCHGAPLPGKYTADKWLAVLQRMEVRMISKKVVPLSEHESSIVQSYLEKHAKKNEKH